MSSFGTELGSYHLSDPKYATLMSNSTSEQFYFVFTNNNWDGPLSFSYKISYVD